MTTSIKNYDEAMANLCTQDKAAALILIYTLTCALNYDSFIEQCIDLYHDELVEDHMLDYDWAAAITNIRDSTLRAVINI